MKSEHVATDTGKASSGQTISPGLSLSTFRHIHLGPDGLSPITLVEAASMTCVETHFFYTLFIKYGEALPQKRELLRVSPGLVRQGRPSRLSAKAVRQGRLPWQGQFRGESTYRFRTAWGERGVTQRQDEKPKEQ